LKTPKLKTLKRLQKSVWFAAQLLSSWMKFNMNAERYSIEQQENCVSTPESNVSVLTELEEGNNYFIFISFVHSPQMSNDLIGQGSSRRMFSKVHHPIKNGGEFLPSTWNNFLDRSMCLFKFSEINSMRHSEIPQNHFVEFILWNFKFDKTKNFVEFLEKFHKKIPQNLCHLKTILSKCRRAHMFEVERTRTFFANRFSQFINTIA